MRTLYEIMERQKSSLINIWKILHDVGYAVLNLSSRTSVISLAQEKLEARQENFETPTSSNVYQFQFYLMLFINYILLLATLD